MNFNNKAKGAVIIFLYWYRDIVFSLGKLTVAFTVAVLMKIWKTCFIQSI